MSKRDYEIGWGRPPKVYQFKKNQSGNPAGRPRKPTSTIARAIEDILMETIPATVRGLKSNSTALEVILLQLLILLAKGNRRAYRVFHKYEAFAKTKPRVKFRDPKWCAKLYARSLGHQGSQIEQLRKERETLTPEQRDRRKMADKVARMKAGLEPPIIHDAMTAIEAADIYEITLKEPSAEPSRRARYRDRRGILVPGEIIDRVNNTPVSLNMAGQVTTVPRQLGVMRYLGAQAIKGDIKCAEMLIDWHAHSLKHGDFYPETKTVS